MNTEEQTNQRAIDAEEEAAALREQLLSLRKKLDKERPKNDDERALERALDLSHQRCKELEKKVQTFQEREIARSRELELLKKELKEIKQASKTHRYHTEKAKEETLSVQDTLDAQIEENNELMEELKAVQEQFQVVRSRLIALQKETSSP